MDLEPSRGASTEAGTGYLTPIKGGPAIGVVAIGGAELGGVIVEGAIRVPSADILGKP